MAVSVGLMGRISSGKDTAARLLAGFEGYGRVAFADALKRMAYATDPVITFDVFGAPVRLATIVNARGWDAAKVEYPEVRRFLQYLGTEGGRAALGDKVWINATRPAILANEVAGRPTVVTDVRMRNELAEVRRLGMVTIWVERPGFSEDGDHASENELTAADADEVVYNDTSEDVLLGRLREIIAQYG